MQSSTSKLIDEIRERASRISGDRFSVTQTIQHLGHSIAHRGGCIASPIDAAVAAARKSNTSSFRLPIAAHPESIR